MAINIKERLHATSNKNLIISIPTPDSTTGLTDIGATVSNPDGTSGTALTFSEDSVVSGLYNTTFNKPLDTDNPDVPYTLTITSPTVTDLEGIVVKVYINSHDIEDVATAQSTNTTSINNIATKQTSMDGKLDTISSNVNSMGGIRFV